MTQGEHDPLCLSMYGTVAPGQLSRGEVQLPQSPARQGREDLAVFLLAKNESREG